MSRTENVQNVPGKCSRLGSGRLISPPDSSESLRLEFLPRGRAQAPSSFPGWGSSPSVSAGVPWPSSAESAGLCVSLEWELKVTGCEEEFV